MEEATFHPSRASLHILNHNNSHSIVAVSSVTTGNEHGISNNVNKINSIDEESVVQASNQLPSTSSDSFYGVVWIFWIIYREENCIQ